jgi:DNA polymerase III sliding clamp (beta) subunit (PCNA family)
MTTVLPAPTETATAELIVGDLIELLQAVSPFAATDLTIPMLVAIHLEGDGKEIVSSTTDRYVLGTYTVPYEGAPFVFNLAMSDVKTILPVLKGLWKRYGDRMPVTLTLKDDVLSFVTYDGEIRARSNGDDFPKVRSLLVDDANATPVEGLALNPTYMARFAKVANRTEPMRLTFTGRNKSVGVKIGERFVGLIMTMRVGG